MGARATRALSGSAAADNNRADTDADQATLSSSLREVPPTRNLSSSVETGRGIAVVTKAVSDTDTSRGAAGLTLLPAGPQHLLTICTALQHLTLVSINLSSRADLAAPCISNLWFSTCILNNVCPRGPPPLGRVPSGSFLSIRVPPRQPGSLLSSRPTPQRVPPPPWRLSHQRDEV